MFRIHFSIPCIYDDIGELGEGLVSVKKDGKWGYLNQSGEIVIPLIYEYAHTFKNGYAPIMIHNTFKNIDKYGNIVQLTEFENGEPSEGLAFKMENRKIGFIDKQGNYIIPPKFSFAEPFSEGLAAVALNYKMGFINTVGAIIIPFQYDEVYGFHNSIAAVRYNNKWGFVDKNGHEIITCQYDSFKCYFIEGLSAVKNNNKWGYINRKGETIIPFMYDDANAFHNGLAAV